MRQKSGGTVSVLITLGLFTVFTLFLLLVLMTGTTAFKSVSASMEERFKQRTALFYVTQKVRHAESGSHISLSEIGGRSPTGTATAVTIRENFDGEVYLTYIYESGGYLKELFIEESEAEQSTGLADEGFEVLETDGVTFEQIMPNLIKITCGGDTAFVNLPVVSESKITENIAENSEDGEFADFTGGEIVLENAS